MLASFFDLGIIDDTYLKVMETLEKNRPLDLEAQTRAFLNECENIVGIFNRGMKVPIFMMSTEDQQSVVDRLNEYLKFEYSQAGIPKSLPIRAKGHGVLFACDGEGAVLGAEIISDDIVVDGKMSAVVSLPVPTLNSLIESGDGEILVKDQVLAPVIMIDDAKYMSGLKEDGGFGFVYDLSDFQVGLAMAHDLTFQVQV